MTLGKSCFHKPLKTQDFKFASVEDGLEESAIRTYIQEPERHERAQERDELNPN